jgi:hypothetical protein
MTRKPMKIKGCKVTFGLTKRGFLVWGSEPWMDEVIRQRWDIEKLDLYGWVVISQEGRPKSLGEIMFDINEEVTYDLEQRLKRKHGIKC